MNKAIGVEGCTTSHGGTVKASQTTKAHHGIPMLQKGDGFMCPKCKIWSTLIEGNSILSFDGVRAAVEDDRFSCGAILIAKQYTARTYSGSLQGNSNISSNSLLNIQFEYGQQFIIQDELTGEPLAEVCYEIHKRSGEIIHGTTDHEGLTELITGDDEDDVELKIISKEHNHD